MNVTETISTGIISTACMVAVWLLFFTTTPTYILPVQEAHACFTGCTTNFGAACSGVNSCGEPITGTLSCGGFCYASTLVISTDEDFYRVNRGATVRANEGNVCHSLKNASGPSNGVFVPGKTLTEFYSYRSNNPPGTSGTYIDWAGSGAVVNF